MKNRYFACLDLTFIYEKVKRKENQLKKVNKHYKCETILRSFMDYFCTITLWKLC